MKRPPQFAFHRRPANGRAATGPLPENGELPLLRLREPEGPPPPRPRKHHLLQPLPLAGLALVLVALLGYLAVYSQATRRTQVLVAARDLPAGTILNRADLRSAGLAGDRAVLGSLMPARQLALVLGRRLTVALPQGLPLARAALTLRAGLPPAFTVAVPVLHALGGALQPGDRVSVIATFASAAGGAQTRAIARGLEVLAVGQPPAGFEQNQATIPITLALPDPSLASALALASEAGKIDLLRDGNATASAPIPPVKVGG